jgi:hypothetical protein
MQTTIAEPIRWTRGKNKYELYHSTLDSINLEAILSHCKAIKHKVKRVVGVAAQLGPSYFEVFPRRRMGTVSDHLGHHHKGSPRLSPTIVGFDGSSLPAPIVGDKQYD